MEGLLRLARAEEAGETATVDLAGLAADRVDTWSAMADAAGVALELEAPGGAVDAVAVAGGVEQILDNLIDNAVGVSPQGTRVLVRVTRGRTAHELTVQDQGPGLSDELKERALDRFWRADRSTPHGLGLPIAAALARASGGSLELRDAPQGGLAVAVRLRPRRTITLNLRVRLAAGARGVPAGPPPAASGAAGRNRAAPPATVDGDDRCANTPRRAARRSHGPGPSPAPRRPGRGLGEPGGPHLHALDKHGMAGSGTSAAVFDLTTKEYLYELRPDVLRGPASNEKLVTSSTALASWRPGTASAPRSTSTQVPTPRSRPGQRLPARPRRPDVLHGVVRRAALGHGDRRRAGPRARA